MRILAVVILMLLVVGCTKQNIKISNTKFPEGQKLYFSKCGGCHRLYDRLEFSPERWDSIVYTMRPKAKTTMEQEVEILHFLKERD
jgi:mono/diheme cytochrome c family protein